MIKIILNILVSITWELPQNIIGFILFVINTNNNKTIEMINNHIFINTSNFSVSFGRFIFWNDNVNIVVKKNNKSHEFGHSIQSLIFGPLYLLFIGLPSILRKIYSMCYFFRYKNKWKDYPMGYPEKWANDLGKKYYKDK